MGFGANAEWVNHRQAGICGSAEVFGCKINHPSGWGELVCSPALDWMGKEARLNPGRELQKGDRGCDFSLERSRPCQRWR
jgi:hypothetical protein